MKNCWVALALTSLLGAASFAQTIKASPTTLNSPPTAASDNNAEGTPILVELKKGLNAHKVKPGEEVKAQVVQDVISHGKLVIRSGSKLTGHVTRVKPRTREDGESFIGVVFDKVRVKGGHDIDLHSAGLQALAAPAQYSMVDKPEEMLPPNIVSASLAQSRSPSPVGSRGGNINSRGAAGPQATVNTGTPNLASSAAQLRPIKSEAPEPYKGSVLSSGSRGIFGIPGLKLQMDRSRDPEKTVISSTVRDVKLDSGVQMLLLVPKSFEQ